MASAAGPGEGFAPRALLSHNAWRSGVFTPPVREVAVLLSQHVAPWMPSVGRHNYALGSAALRAAGQSQLSFYFYFLLIFIFGGRVSSEAWLPGNGLRRLRRGPSVRLCSRVLRLKVWTTTPGSNLRAFFFFFFLDVFDVLVDCNRTGKGLQILI